MLFGGDSFVALAVHVPRSILTALALFGVLVYSCGVGQPQAGSHNADAAQRSGLMPTYR